MNKNLLITLVIIVGLFAGLILIVKPTPNTENGNSTAKADIGLTASEKNYDFGTISMAEGTVTHKFTVKNTSESTVQLTKMYTSCMCTTATLIKGENKFGPMGMPGHGGSVPSFRSELQPGEEAEVEIAFDPTAHGPAGVGRIDRSIFLESNGQTALEYQFVAFVKP